MLFQAHPKGSGDHDENQSYLNDTKTNEPSEGMTDASYMSKKKKGGKENQIGDCSCRLTVIDVPKPRLDDGERERNGASFPVQRSARAGTLVIASEAMVNRIVAETWNA